MTAKVRFLLAWSILVVAIVMQGCVTAAAVGGTAAAFSGGAVYRRGWYRTVVPAPHYIVDKAMRATGRRAGLIERERVCDGYKSFYRYQDLRDNKAKIKLKAVTPDSTRVYIRIGFWGDRNSSVELFQGLQEDIDALSK